MTELRIKLPKKLAAKLDRLAKSERKPATAVVREAVEHRLMSKPNIDSGSAYDLVKHLVGTLEGPSDLATNPKYMKGFGE